MGFLDEEGLNNFWNLIKPKLFAGGDGSPVGTIISYMGKTAPTGYLICDGTVKNVSEYPALAQHIKTQFGSSNYFGGDGTTTFAVPDLRGRFLLDHSEKYALGSTGGEEEHTLTVEEMPQHTHSNSAMYGGKFATAPGNGADTQLALEYNGYTSPRNTGYVGNSRPHNNMPPYMTVSYCIKAVDKTPQTDSAGIPAGLISMWSGAEDAVPDGWALCNGENGTPDLRGRFVLGSSTSYVAGSKGGSATVTLTEDQMPQHEHRASITSLGKYDSTGTYAASTYAKTVIFRDIYTGSTGGSQPHNNMPPYYALCYIMKL